jgi:endonuclease-8
MPEGDTIHNTARRLQAALVGHQITRFELRRDPRGVRAPQPGATITSVDAEGKHLLIAFDDGAVLHTHMQLTGAWHVYAPGARWRRPAHRARVIIEVDDGASAVCFDAPVVELRRGTRARTTGAMRSLAALGPDLCTPDADLALALTNAGACDPERPIGDVLLDQRVAAGIGNVFKSEICWSVGVDPTTPWRCVDDDTRRALYTAAHRLLVDATRTGRRATYRGELAVYGRARRPCPRCRTLIKRAATGAPARVSYWCPTCQPAVVREASR